MTETPEEHVEEAGLSDPTAEEVLAADEKLSPLSMPDPLKERAEASRVRRGLIAGLCVFLCTGGVFAAAVYQSELRQNWGQFTGTVPGSTEESSYVSPPLRVERVARVAEATRASIQSDPAGARVTINGRQAGVTPLFAQRLTPGPHRVSVTMDGYASVDTVVQAAATGQMRVAFSLVHQEMPTSVQPPEPPGSAVAVAAAPAADAVESSDQTESPASGEVTSPQQELDDIVVVDPPMMNSSLFIDVEPHGARVIVSGRYVGRTPLEVGSLEAGRHLIRIEHEGYQELEQSVEVTEESRSALTATLAPRMGALRITAIPWGTIYVGDALVASETDHGHVVEMPVGMQRVRASHPTLGTVERMVRILEGQTVEMILDLNETDGR